MKFPRGILRSGFYARIGLAKISLHSLPRMADTHFNGRGCVRVSLKSLSRVETTTFRGLARWTNARTEEFFRLPSDPVEEPAEIHLENVRGKRQWRPSEGGGGVEELRSRRLRRKLDRWE